MIVLSAKANPATQTECFRLGADEFFEKPFDPAVLAASIRRQLERSAASSAESRRDRVTGLPNRGALREHFQAALGMAYEREQPLTLALTELDDLQGIRQRHGRSGVGRIDEETALFIKRNTRGADVVGRWGSGRFLLLFPATRVGPAKQVVERILSDLRTRRISLSVLDRPGGGATRSASVPERTDVRMTLSASLVDARPHRTLEEAVLEAETALLRAEGGRSRMIVPPSKDERSERRTVRVLLVDDDPSIAALVGHRLERDGLNVEHLEDGADALALIQKEDRITEFDLAVLDVKLPGFNGFELLAALRERASRRRLPVVMLTSMGREADIVRAFELGADDYVLKPFSPVELLARIRRLIRIA